MNKTLFLLVRHGQSIANLNHVLVGQSNVDLSELGFAQAKKTADFLTDTHIDAVYSSDLLRAYHTALPHAIKRGLPVILNEGLREIFLGDWEGREKDWLLENCYEDFAVHWVNDFGTFTCPGGESVPHLADRICSTLLKIGKENVGKTVLVGIHAAAIRSFYGKISGIAPEDLGTSLPFADNGSVTYVELVNGCFKPLEYSVSAHLS